LNLEAAEPLYPMLCKSGRATTFSGGVLEHKGFRTLLDPTGATHRPRTMIGYWLAGWLAAGCRRCRCRCRCKSQAAMPLQLGLGSASPCIAKAARDDGSDGQNAEIKTAPVVAPVLVLNSFCAKRHIATSRLVMGVVVLQSAAGSGQVMRTSSWSSMPDRFPKTLKQHLMPPAPTHSSPWRCPSPSEMMSLTLLTAQRQDCCT